MGSFSRKSSEISRLPTLKCDTRQGLDSTHQLGSDYEKKKLKLLQELKLDYKDYVTKVSPQKNNLKPHAPNVHHTGLSLPINERASIKESLREERKKEYNLFLQEQAQKRRLKRETPPVISKQERCQTSDVMSITSQGPRLPFLNSQTNTPLPHKELPASRRDAATLTETGDTGRSARSLSPPRRRRWRIHKPREFRSSEEEELCTDEEQDFDLSRRRRQDKEPRYREEKRTQKHRVDRDFQDLNEMEAPVLSKQSNKDVILESDSKHVPDSMRTAARSTPLTDKAESATGLMIGATEDQTIIQMKKEQYKQELLQQIAEQKRNKIKEKKLELKVAATGATDPEKQPDRIKQFRTRQDAPRRSGADANPADESMRYRAPRGNPQVDFNAPLSQPPGRPVFGPGMGLEQDAPLFDYVNEDYHENFTRTPGEVALPRVASVAPPLPPIVPNMYKAQYDAAHAFYKARNPFEIQDNLQGGDQQFRKFEALPQLPPIRANEGSPFAAEGLPADVSKQRRESALRYQEALKQQIQEREEQKRREREEKERFDAKSEAEMTYDPWGRSGGGAPNKDQRGNLISDLKQMHIINENRMLSPRRGGSPFPHPHQLPESSCSPQQPHIRDMYKIELKQQIEEKRRRLAEEQANRRTVEEMEEKRLQEERARILQQYEEEQRKPKNPKKQKQVHQVQTQHTEEVESPKVENKSTKEENKIVPRSTKEREEKTSQCTSQTVQRPPSPPIPTLQRKLTDPAASKPNSVERTLSAPHVQDVLRNIPTPQGSEGQQEVIKGLSALRGLLKKEQRRLEQLAKTNHSHLGRRRLRMDAFEAANKDSVHPFSRSPASANADKQNKQIQNGGLDDQPSHYYSRRKPAARIPRNASLPFEAAFTGEGQINLQGPQPSEERWEETVSQTKQVVADFLDEREQNDQQGSHSVKSLKAKDTNRRDFERSDYSSRTGSALGRPVSVGTVETDRLRHSEHQSVK